MPVESGVPAGGITRRAFLKWGAGASAGLAAGSLFFVPSRSHAATYGNPVPVETDAAVSIKYSVCLMCHSNCGIRVKLNDVGRVVKIDGNPYHPNGTDSPLPYSTDPHSETARRAAGSVCAKSQSAIETLYNPYRLKHPLKRVGRRGEGKWKRISWDEAIREIASRLAPIRDLSAPIHPQAPELGPKANGLVFTGGRNQHGQKEFTDRFFGNCFGTVNKRHDHTSICETSHHVAFAYMLDKDKNHLKPDLEHCEYVIYFGTNPYEAGFPMVPLARKTQNMRTRAGNPGIMVVVDPRLSRTAGKADVWLPIKPGADGALALALGRRILEQGTYNAAFLAWTSTAHAKSNGETIGSDATWLVNLTTGSFLSPAQAGLGGPAGARVVIRQGGAVSGDATADARTNDVEARGELFVDAVVNGIPVKSTLQLYRDSCFSHSLAEWADICGLDESRITSVADGFAAHGRRAAAEFYRGACQHTNGTYSGMAIIALNWLVGNVNWRGGMAGGGSHYHEMGEAKAGTFYDLRSSVRNGVSAGGVQITRVGARYETSSEYAGKPEGAKYPAARPWFPFAKYGNYQELFPSIGAQYPYPCQALILYWNNAAYSTPGHRDIARQVLTDESKLPFFVAIDVEFGETSSLADILLPDVTFLEQWMTPHVAPTMLTTISGIRQPVVGTINGTPVHQLAAMPAHAVYRSIYPDCRQMIDMLIEIGKALGLPGVGADAFPEELGFDGTDFVLDNAWDWYKRMIANVAGEAGALVPGGAQLEKINYVLARGGVFDPITSAYDAGNPNLLAKKFDKSELHFYVEDFATALDSMTGAGLSGTPRYEPIKTAGDRPLAHDPSYPLTLVTYKPAWHAQARTIVNSHLVALQPENFIEMSAEDAAARGIRTGDLVRVRSGSSPRMVVGRAQVLEGMRPGVVAMAHSFGHWEMSSRDHVVNGTPTGYDPARGRGVQANLVMENDPDLAYSVCLQDKIGGSASFYDSRVQVEKAG